MGDFDFTSASVLDRVASGDTGRLRPAAEHDDHEREIYVHPDASGYVLKREPDWSDQNQMEVQRWNVAVRDGYERFFAEIVDYTDDREWIMMERADRMATRDEAMELWRRMNAAGVACNDFRVDGVGVFGGRPKMVDYESCQQKQFLRDWKLEKWRSAGP